MCADRDVQGRSFELVVESEPLGNVGCVRRFAGKARSLLVTFADNLTALPMQRLLQHHSALGWAMTLAVHDQPFLVPFGVLAVHGDEVVSYEEKPVMPITVASGTAALSPEAMMAPQEMASADRAGLTFRHSPVNEEVAFQPSVIRLHWST